MFRFRTLILALAALLMCGPAFAQGSPTVYVTDGNEGDIQILNTSLATFAGTPLSVGGTLKGIEYGPDGRLYVCDPSAGKIYRVDPVSSAVATVYDHTATAGPANPQCGRFSSVGDFYVVDQLTGSGVWKFTAASLITLPASPAPSHTLGSGVLGATFGGNSSLTQANNGDLLINEFANGNLWLSPAPLYTTATNIAPYTFNDATGIARNSTGDIFIAQKGVGTNSSRVQRFTSAGTFVSDCGLFTGGTFGDQPYFIKFSADDTLYVSTSQANDNSNLTYPASTYPFDNGKIWKINISNCGVTPPTPTFIANMPPLGTVGPNEPAFGIALPLTDTNTAISPSKTITASTPRNFNFGFTSFQISDNTTCSATVNAIQTLQSALSTGVSTISPIVPTGTKLVPYLGEAGFGTLYHVTSGCTLASVLAGAFTPTLTNPRIVKCDPFPTSCQALTTNAVYPLGGPIPGDGSVGGKVPNFSDFFLIDEGLSTATGVAGHFCGWNPPLNGTQNPATAPVFHTSLTTTIPVKFQLGDGNACKKFISNAQVLLSVAQVLTPGNVSVFIPLAPAQFGGHGSDPSLFDFVGKQYIFNLIISSLPPGTYSASLTFLTGNAPTQTTYFKIVSP
jgi:hypothetical protein